MASASSPSSPAPPAGSLGKATAFQLRLGLQGLIVHFKSTGYIRDKTAMVIDSVVLGRVLGFTSRDQGVREHLGRESRVWNDLQQAIDAAVPSLEKRSVAGPDPASPEYDSPSGPLIAANYPTLVKDIDRVHKLVEIAKNILAAGEYSQDYAAKLHFDIAIFKLISLCVKVTARGFDGESGPDEEKWQLVVNDYKRLLIICLQVLNNFVAQNERMKLKLWAHLLENPGEDVLGRMMEKELSRQSREDEENFRDSPRSEAMEVLREAQRIMENDGRRPPSDWGPFLLFCTEIAGQAQEEFRGRHVEKPVPLRMAQICFNKWAELSDEDFQKWHDEYQRTFAKADSRLFPSNLVGPQISSASKPQEPLRKYNATEILQESERRFKQSGHPSSEYGPFSLFVSRAIIAFERDEGGLATASVPGTPAFLQELVDDWKAMDESVLKQWDRLYEDVTDKDHPFSKLLEDNGIFHAACRLYGHNHPDAVPNNVERSIDAPSLVKRWDQLAEKIYLECDNCGQHFCERAPAESHEAEHGHHMFIQTTEESYREADKLGKATPPRIHRLMPHNGEQSQHEHQRLHPLDICDPFSYIRDPVFNISPATPEDYGMAYDATHGSGILQNAKDDLMKKLDPYADRLTRPGAVTAASAGQDAPATSESSPIKQNNPQSLPRTADYISDEESDDDFGIPGDDGRGLLTDVPLILGPNEIEVLPMLILTCIIPPTYNPSYSIEDKLMIADLSKDTAHMDRCNLLLRQDNGRNLLRELLIFVAAWDLREDELYFKFMAKIMEAVLDNGLMKFAYHSFRDKDIISPAQAVIMKLLTNIYRARQVDAQLVADTREDSPPVYPTRVDVHMVNYLLTEFRQHIVPRTCALIFLQGKIRHGHAHAEDFPLNLWDMERMYEGVYQYLEFFAILTECDTWKNMMADWDITCELVTLLKELNTAVPCSLLAREMEKLPPNVAKQHERATNGPPLPQDLTAAQPVSVERPYDLSASGGPSIPESTLSFHQPTSTAPLAPASAHGAHEDEPSDFPWKNLKKLTVLVLSSLTWRNPKVQNQVREHEGIETMLNCTKHDDFNPYIREHAIMALRFLVEGNEENRQVVRRLEAKIARYDAKTARASANAAAGAEAASDHADKKKASRATNHGPDAMPPPVLPASASSSAAAAAMAAAGEHLGLANKGLPSASLFNLMTEVMTQIPAKFRDEAGIEKHRAELLKALDREFDAAGSDGGKAGGW